MTLNDIVVRVLKNNIPIVGVSLTDDNSLAYVVSGFSKSGTATIYEKDGEIHCLQRYNRDDVICDFHGLACIAFRWNENYINDGFSWDVNWLPVFLQKGWLREKKQITYEVV